MWAAIRYRRAQALVLVLLATLVTACATFAPLYERALEQSLLRKAIDATPAAPHIEIDNRLGAPDLDDQLRTVLSFGLEPGSSSVGSGT